MKISDIPFKKKYLIIWTVICIASACPSFFFAAQEGHDIVAMLLGVSLFIAAYTVFSSSIFFEKLQEAKILRRAFKFAFGVRLLQSLIALFSFAGLVAATEAKGMTMLSEIGAAAVMIDGMIGGMAAYPIYSEIAGIDLPSDASRINEGLKTFWSTFFITIIQGILLNIVILLIMLAAAVVQLPFAAKERIERSSD